MNIALWIVQIILAIKLISVSYTHGFRQSIPTMQAAIQSFGKPARPILYIMAACTFLGSIGLILPMILGAPAWVTPITALILSILLLFSIFLHTKSREKPKIFVSIILFIFAAFVAYGRWVVITN